MGNSVSCFDPVREHPPYSWPKDHPGRKEAIMRQRQARKNQKIQGLQAGARTVPRDPSKPIDAKLDDLETNKDETVDETTPLKTEEKAVDETIAAAETTEITDATQTEEKKEENDKPETAADGAEKADEELDAAEAEAEAEAAAAAAAAAATATSTEIADADKIDDDKTQSPEAIIEQKELDTDATEIHDEKDAAEGDDADATDVGAAEDERHVDDDEVIDNDIGIIATPVDEGEKGETENADGIVEEVEEEEIIEETPITKVDDVTDIADELEGKKEEDEPITETPATTEEGKEEHEEEEEKVDEDESGIPDAETLAKDEETLNSIDNRRAIFDDSDDVLPEVKEVQRDILDPVTKEHISLEEYRRRQRERAQGVVRERVDKFEEIDEETSKQRAEHAAIEAARAEASESTTWTFKNRPTSMESTEDVLIGGATDFVTTDSPPPPASELIVEVEQDSNNNIVEEATNNVDDVIENQNDEIATAIEEKKNVIADLLPSENVTKDNESIPEMAKTRLYEVGDGV